MYSMQYMYSFIYMYVYICMYYGIFCIIQFTTLIWWCYNVNNSLCVSLFLVTNLLNECKMCSRNVFLSVKFYLNKCFVTQVVILNIMFIKCFLFIYFLYAIFVNKPVGCNIKNQDKHFIVYNIVDRLYVDTEEYRTFGYDTYNNHTMSLKIYNPKGVAQKMAVKWLLTHCQQRKSW